MAHPTSGQENSKCVDNGHTKIIEHRLVYTPSIITELSHKGFYTGGCHPSITDSRYSTKRKNGIVRYNFISGETLRWSKEWHYSGKTLKRNDGWLYRYDLETYFHERGMRFPNAAETLLALAKDKQLGCGAHPLIAFIDNSFDAFIASKNRSGRNLRLLVKEDPWDSFCEFLVVYK